MVVEEDKPVAYSEPALAERNVTMSNALTRAAHSLTLAEKRLIAACIAKNDSIPFVELRREGAWRVRLSAAEYAEAFGVDANTAYEQLQGLATACSTATCARCGKPAEGRRNSSSAGWVVRSITRARAGSNWSGSRKWCRTCSACARNSRPTSCARRPLCARSTPGACSSASSPGRPPADTRRRSRNFIGQWMRPESQRKNFKDLRRRVIEPAVKELREKNGLHIEWEPETAGRKVVKLDFRFRVSPQGALF